MKVEPKVFEEDLMFARDVGIQEIIPEDDSLVVYGISSLLHEFHGFQISHKRRNGNQLAHLLVEHAQSVECCALWAKGLVTELIFFSSTKYLEV